MSSQPFDSPPELSFKEKIRSISFGTPRKARVVVDRDKDLKHVELVHEDHGGRAGYESHHPDGSWDCTMTPDPVNLPLSPSQEH